MATKQLLAVLLTASLSIVAARAQTNTADYAWLTTKSLPQPAAMLDAALASLPRSVRDQGDWLARMKKAAWVPSLELRYGVSEAGFREYKVIDGQTVSTSTETTRESGKSRDVTTDISPTPGSSIDNGTQSRSSTTKGTTTTTEPRTSYARDDHARLVNDYGIYLTWDLSRIIFRSEEMNVLSAEMSKAGFRDNVRDQVIKTYYDLKEALMMLENESFKDSVQIKIQKERYAFLLDTLTGGELTNRGQPKK